MLTKHEDGYTLLQLLCKNSALTPKMWSPEADLLAGALANNDTKLARSLVAGLTRPKGPKSGEGGSAEPAPGLDDGISITPGAVPGLLDNLMQLYAIGLGALATDILREHGLVPAGYTLNATYTRVDLEDSFASAGSNNFKPNSINWSDHLQPGQYKDSSNAHRKDVKPVVLAVCGAGHAGDKGLVHLLVKPNVPVAVFATRAVKLLVAHKWREFGNGMFLREVATFVAQVASWQTLAAVVAQSGGDVVADLDPWQAVAGMLLAAASSLTWLPTLAEACLQLSPRTDISQKSSDPTFIWYVVAG
jgi:hypothetical protein